jgi:hypothetical protein
VASWKKILVEGDNTNLGSSNLTQSDAARTYTVSGTTSSLSIKSEHGGNLARFVSGAVNSANDLVTLSAGVVEVAGSASAGAGTLRLKEASCNGGDYVNLTVPNLTSTYTVTLPAAAPGGNNKILESDSNGDLSWITTPSGGGTTINNNADNSLITGSGTANTLEGETNLTYDGTNLAIVAGGIDLDNNKAISAKNTGGVKRTLALANASNQAVFNAGFNETLIGGGSGITLNGPVTANEFIQEHSSGISSAGDYGDGADITFLGSSGTSVVAGKIYYYNGTTWALYSTAVAASQISLLGMAVGSTMSSGFILRGFVRPSLVDAQLTAGQTVFSSSSNGAGQVTSTAPTTGYQRILGHAVSTSVIYFNPSVEHIELA